MLQDTLTLPCRHSPLVGVVASFSHLFTLSIRVEECRDLEIMLALRCSVHVMYT